MFNDKQKLTIYSKYDVSNVAKSEDFVHIIRPDKSSEVYKQFEKMITDKINLATKWLSSKNIEYTWNERIDGHLYRLVILDKNVVFDFEYYPVITQNYKYIRINYDTDIIEVLERLFPEVVLETSELSMNFGVSQKEINKFLRKNRHSPIYDKHVLRLAWVKDATIYQCFVIKNCQIIANVTERNHKVNWGTYMCLRYLTEALCFPEIIIKDRCDNSLTLDFYKLAGFNEIKSTPKRKIWWSPQGTRWHPEDTSDYIPFYFTEQITYSYKHK